MGIEPTSQPWQGRVLTVVLHLHGISVAISGPARLSLTPTTAPLLVWGIMLSMLANGTNYGEWCGMTGSNRRPPACKADALPAELIPHLKTWRGPHR